MNMTNETERALYALNVGENLIINHPEQIPTYDVVAVPGGWIFCVIVGAREGDAGKELFSTEFVPRPMFRPKQEEPSSIMPVKIKPVLKDGEGS